MNMNRNSFILAGVLVVLVVAAYFLLQKQGERDISVDAAQHFVTLDSSSVDQISIKSSSDSVLLKKLNGTWFIKNPISYKANNAAVTEFLHTVKEMRIKSLASSNVDKQSLFKVDSSGTLVTISENGNHDFSFYVGKTGQSYNDTYVRMAESNNVMLVNAMLTYTVAKKVKDWRDKTIFAKPKESITEISYQYGDTTFTLVSSDHGWVIGKDSLQDKNVSGVISALSNFQAEDFLDTPTAATKKIMAQISIGADQIRFAYDSAAKKYYVQTSDAQQWFIVEPWKANQILKRKKDFLKS